jgi:hypothetical protein
MALKIVQMAGAAMWIVVALSSPRLTAGDSAGIKIGGLGPMHPVAMQSTGH